MKISYLLRVSCYAIRKRPYIGNRYWWNLVFFFLIWQLNFILLQDFVVQFALSPPLLFSLTTLSPSFIPFQLYTMFSLPAYNGINDFSLPLIIQIWFSQLFLPVVSFSYLNCLYHWPYLLTSTQLQYSAVFNYSPSRQTQSVSGIIYLRHSVHFSISSFTARRDDFDNDMIII